MDIPQDLSAAGAGAEAFLSSTPEVGGDGTSAQPQQSQAPQQQATATPTLAAAPSSHTTDQPTPLTLDDQKTYLWTDPATGTTAPKTGKEIKAGYLMQADYTRKSQETATLRKQIEPYLAERDRVASILQDPQQYLQFAAQHLGPQAVQQLTQAILAAQQQQPAPIDPNQIATVGDAQRYAQEQRAAFQQELAQARQQLQQESRQLTQQVRDEIAVAEHSKQINPVVKAVFEQHPILAAVPNAEDTIRFEIFQRTKAGVITTQEQAIQAFKDLGAQYAGQLEAKFQELQKATAAQQQSLVTNGIEPPGGALVQHQGLPKPPLQADGRLDWDAFGKGAEGFIRSLGG